MPRTNRDASRLWNRQTAGLIPYTPGEQPRDRVFIKLNTNENPYPAPDSVQDVLRRFDYDRLRLYPDPTSLALRERIAAYYGLDPAHVFVGNGSDEVLALAFQAFFPGGEPADRLERADPARSIVFPDITYSFYPVYARLYGIPWRTVRLRDDFTVPIDELLAPAAGVVLANPNAPTGIAVSCRALAELAACDRNRLLLIDEAYVDFGAESAVSLLERYDNILVVQTCSKSRALAGIRLGFALGAPMLIEALQRVRDSFNSYTVDCLAQSAGQAAFTAAAWFEQTRARIIASRTRLSRALTDLGCQVLPSAANFVLVRHPGHTGDALYRRLRENGILVRHFNLPRIADFLRITIGTDAEIDTLIRVLSLILI
jgi:histidinol-phosphate aminotransferase